MFTSQTKVRMNDTDAAGILYFANQFRFAHDAFEDFMDSEGVSFGDIFKKSEIGFVIVHVEADYHMPVTVGDPLEVQLNVEKIGTTSFTIQYLIYRKDQKVGAAKTCHVCVDMKTESKIKIPPHIHKILSKHSL